MDGLVSQLDLFIVAGEASGDLQGSKLIDALPPLHIGAVAGPRMRERKIQTFFPMENLQVMGFIDVIAALPKLMKQFFAIRNQILKLNPKAVVCIDYPGFNLRLQKSLRKKGYRGKIIHYVCPTVWAWKKNRIYTMEKTLDRLLVFFPFEPACFAQTKLPVQFVGHPLTAPIASFKPKGKYQGKILSLFPGSRKKEIERNLPLQLKVAEKLKKEDPQIQIIVSIAHADLEPLVRKFGGFIVAPPEDHYELMSASRMAIATSGTVTLELALHKVPTVVTFAIRKLDCWLAQKIFRINLPFYALPNIVLSKQVFPELFGPNLTVDRLEFWARKIWSDEESRKSCFEACSEIHKSLGVNDASREAANAIIRELAF
jgi:lipid-A-disaccharide synthase